MQPGVASVHASVLQKSPTGVAFYIRDFPQMVSMTYGDVRRRFNTSILCGWFSGEERLPHLNPKDDYVFKHNDQLIFLANTGTWWLKQLMRSCAVTMLQFCSLKPSRASVCLYKNLPSVQLPALSDDVLHASIQSFVYQYNRK